MKITHSQEIADETERRQHGKDSMVTWQNLLWSSLLFLFNPPVSKKVMWLIMLWPSVLYTLKEHSPPKHLLSEVTNCPWRQLLCISVYAHICMHVLYMHVSQSLKHNTRLGRDRCLYLLSLCPRLQTLNPSFCLPQEYRNQSLDYTAHLFLKALLNIKP